MREHGFEDIRYQGLHVPPAWKPSPRRDEFRIPFGKQVIRNARGYAYRRSGVPLEGHEITTPDVRMIKTPQNFKSPIGVRLPEILCGDKGTGVLVGQIYDVHSSGSSCFHGAQWIFRIPNANLHPGGHRKSPCPEE